jgi:hypothetical protein
MTMAALGNPKPRSSSVPRMSSSSRPAKTDVKVCFRCGSKDHFARDCTRPAPSAHSAELLSFAESIFPVMDPTEEEL